MRRRVLLRQIADMLGQLAYIKLWRAVHDGDGDIG
jgi:hypothetical protein